MGLTRIRANQISDIDYKQAVRVITLTNITLAGGAPDTVDGISLAAGDRILVAGQSNAAQNGLYQVQTVGTGSDGTWVRTSDANEDGEIQPGMVVMVTQGTVYADTPWKLVTNGEIIIGTTELTFQENYSLAFGNIFANGTAVIANAVSAPVTFAAGDNIAITGNNTTKTVTIGVTGISLNSISNGTSNVTVVSSGGNVTVAVAGSEVAEFSTVGLDVTGNITGSNIATAGELKSTGTFVIGTQQFFAQGSDGFSVNENFNAGNATVTAYHYTSGAGRNGIVFDTAVTGQFTNGFGATGNAAQNKFVSFAEFSNTTWEWRKGVGISAPNLNGGTLLANINPDGNLYTLGTITATGNITGANVNGGNLSLTGNVVSALNVTGNIAGNYFIGNGSQLTGIATSAFDLIQVTGQANVDAATSTTLTFVAGDGISITTDAGNTTVTFAGSSAESIFATGGDMGLVTQSPTSQEDLGLITDAVTESYDLGTIVTTGVIFPDLLVIDDLADFQLAGGTAGQVLTTYGNSTLYWATIPSSLTIVSRSALITVPLSSGNILEVVGRTGNIEIYTT